MESFDQKVLTRSPYIDLKDTIILTKAHLMLSTNGSLQLHLTNVSKQNFSCVQRYTSTRDDILNGMNLVTMEKVVAAVCERQPDQEYTDSQREKKIILNYLFFSRSGE